MSDDNDTARIHELAGEDPMTDEPKTFVDIRWDSTQGFTVWEVNGPQVDIGGKVSCRHGFSAFRIPDPRRIEPLEKRVAKLEAEARRYYTGDGSVMDLDPKQVIEMRKDAAKRMVQLENQRLALQLHSQHIENLLALERNRAERLDKEHNAALQIIREQCTRLDRLEKLNTQRRTPHDEAYAAKQRVAALECENGLLSRRMRHLEAVNQVLRDERKGKRGKLKARLERLEEHVYNLEHRIEDIENEGQ